MDEAARELVRDWLTRASHDLQAARTTIPFPRRTTSKIWSLKRRSCTAISSSLRRRQRGGGSDESMPSPEEFDEALQHAKTIYDFVLNLLPMEARP